MIQTRTFTPNSQARANLYTPTRTSTRYTTTRNELNLSYMTDQNRVSIHDSQLSTYYSLATQKLIENTRQDFIQCNLVNQHEKQTALEIMLTIAVDYNNLKLFTHTIHSFAELASHCYYSDLAFFLYNQLVSSKTIKCFFLNQRIVADKSANYKLKIDALMGMGKQSLSLKNPQMALLFFKRGIQYCWQIKDKETELDFYEGISKAHFYLGNVAKTQLFYFRASEGALEDQSSPIKLISNENLEDYENNKFGSTQYNVNQILLSMLHLPLLSLEKCHLFNSESARPTYDFKKCKWIVEVNTNKMFDQLVLDPEFIKVIPSPRCTIYLILIPPTVAQNVIKYETKTKPKRFPQKSYVLPKFDKSILKYPLDQAIKQRLTVKHPNLDIIQLVREIRSKSEVRSPIYTNHVSKELNLHNRRRVTNSFKHLMHMKLNKLIQMFVALI